MDVIKCACGCGKDLDKKDKYDRIRKYISGHNNRKYDHDDKYAVKKAWVKRNRKSVNLARQKRRIKRKQKILVEYTNKQCNICGIKYDGKNGAIFHFHHINPEEKEAAISVLLEYSEEKLLTEIEKCELLCSNCHLILHNGKY